MLNTSAIVPNAGNRIEAKTGAIIEVITCTIVPAAFPISPKRAIIIDKPRPIPIIAWSGLMKNDAIVPPMRPIVMAKVLKPLAKLIIP